MWEQTTDKHISNELQNKTTVTIADPEYSQKIMDRHAERITLIRTNQANILAARRAHLQQVQVAVAATPLDADLQMQLALIQNQIAEDEFEAQVEVKMQLTDEEKTQSSNAWRTHRELNTNLTKHWGQAFSLILAQTVYTATTGQDETR